MKQRSYDTMIALGASDIPIYIEYNFTPGSPEQGPSYSSGGQPADPAEIEITKIVILDHEIPAGNLFNFLASDELFIDELHLLEDENERDDAADHADYINDWKRDEA